MSLLSRIGRRDFAVRAAVIAAVTASLAACGGGGGGGGKAPVLPKTFSVSGQIQIAANDYVDNDTADTNGAIFLPRNNEMTSPQFINNPATIGGYVSNRAGAYPYDDGAFTYVPDATDYYRVSMIKGQEISLMPDRASDKLLPTVVQQTLTVWAIDKNTQELNEPATSLTNANAKTYKIEASGDYLIRIEESTGPSTYTLTVGEFTTDSLDPVQSLSVPAGARFVTGEALVTFEKSSGYSVASAGNSIAADIMNSQSVIAIEALTESIDTHRITFDMSSSVSTASAGTSTGTDRTRAELETLQRIAELSQQPGIAHAEPNFIRAATAMPTGTNPLRRYQWHYDSINVAPAWELTEGTGATVAVLDTGIYSSHVELKDQIQGGCDFVSNLNSSLDNDGVDIDPTDPGDSLVGSSSFHGTHVAGTIAAAANDNGGVGIAFGAKLVPIRVLGKNGEGSDFDIARAIRYAAGLEDVSECNGLMPKVDIINLSLGSAGNSHTLRAAVMAATEAGVTVVAAAGNDSTATPFYPAGYPEVISVGAVGLDLVKAPYSNFGSTLTLVAPGGNTAQDLNADSYSDGVMSSWVNDSENPARATYSFMQGTSMAAPHVSGVLALVQAYRRKNSPSVLTPAEIMAFIEAGDFTRDIGEPQRDDAYGYGIIDAYKAVSAVAGNAMPTPVIRSSKANFSFTLSGSAKLVLDIPDGATIISAAPVTTDSLNWLDLSAVGADGKTYTVTADASTDGLSIGVSYPGLIRFVYESTNDEETNTRTLNIPVVLEIPDPDVASDAGRHYVLLINTLTGEALEDRVLASNGVYDFSFAGVPAGEYQIYAGSDLDGDGFICDLGEACAAFPVRNLPDTIVLNGNREGLSFQTSFENDITAEGSSSDERISSILSGKGIKRLRAGATSQNSQRVRQLDAG